MVIDKVYGQRQRLWNLNEASTRRALTATELSEQTALKLELATDPVQQRRDDYARELTQRARAAVVSLALLLACVSGANAQTYHDPDAAYARCQFTTAPAAYNLSPVCDMDPLFNSFGARETITQASMFRQGQRAKTYVNIVNGESSEQRVIVEYAGLTSGTVLVQKRTLAPDQRLSIELNQHVPFNTTTSYFSVTVKFETSGSFSMSWHDAATFAELHSQEGKVMPRAEVR